MEWKPGPKLFFGVFNMNMGLAWWAIVVAVALVIPAQASEMVDTPAAATSAAGIGVGPSNRSETSAPVVSLNNLDQNVGHPISTQRGSGPNAYRGADGSVVIGECNPFTASTKGLDFSVVTITSTLDGTPPDSTPTYGTETGIQVGRLTRDGISSECGTPKPNPGNWTVAGDRQYDLYRFVALNSGCVMVTLRDAGEWVLFSAAYVGNEFSASDPEMSYLADIGSSPNSTTPVTMGFDVVAGQIFEIVVHEVEPAGGVGQAYTLDLEGVKLEPEFSVETTLDASAAPQSPAYYRYVGWQTGRLNRDGIVSTCESPKPNPGLFTPTDDRLVDLYSFIPAGTGCMLVSIAQTQAGTGVELAITYDENGYNPSNPLQNYLADIGWSAFNSTRFYSFYVMNGVPFDLAVHEVHPGTGTGDEYFLNLSNVPVIPTIVIPTILDGTPPHAGIEYTSSTGEQTGRINRFSPAATCDEPKANPGIYTATGARRYDKYTFVPPGSGCVEVTLLTATAGFTLYAAAYDQNGFFPGSPGANYLADAGSSPSPESPTTFSFIVASGVPFTIVVHEVNPGGGFGDGYQLNVGGVVFWESVLPLFYDGFETGDTSQW